MKIKLNKIIIIFMAMIIMVGTLSYLDEEKIVLKDISGDRNALENISIVYNTSREDRYDLRYDENSVGYIGNEWSLLFSGISFNTADVLGINSKKEEVVINNDGVKHIKTKNPIKGNFINYNKKYQESINSYIEANNYENDKYVGSVSISNRFNNINEQYLEIKRINKKNNKLETIELSLGEEFYVNPEDEYNQIIESYSYDDDLYLVLRNIKHMDESNKEKIFILKINKELDSYQVMKTIDLKSEDSYSNFQFVNKDKIYINMTHYGSDNLYDYFIIYDISKNEVIYIEDVMLLKDKDNYSSDKLLHYYVENDNLNILIKDSKDYVSKLIYSLKDFKLVNEEKYDFQINFNSNYYDIEGINKVFYIDDKIITIYRKEYNVRRKNKKGKHYEIKANHPININVFDTNSNKLVYEGEIISSNKDMKSKLFLVKDY